MGSGPRLPMLLPVQALARVLPQVVLSGSGPGLQSIDVSLFVYSQCWSPRQSSLLLQEVEQVYVDRSHVPPQGHWVSA